MGKVEYKARVLRHIFSECYREVDGYWVWAPREIHGAYTEADLEMIALLLKEANRLWDNEIQAYFATHPKTPEPHVVKELDTPWGRLPVIEF